MNLEELQKMIAETVEKATGMSPDEFKAFRAEVKKAEDRAAETHRQHTAELAHGYLPKAYAQKARHVLRSDPHEGAALKTARYIRTMAAANGNPATAIEIAKGRGDDWLAEDISGAYKKALAAGTFASGGAIVPDEYVAELIELLRAQAVIRQAGAMVVPMRSGSMTLPRQSGAGSAAYVGENTNITKSEQTFDQIQLSAKKLAALTPISNDLLRESDPAADQIVRDDLTRVQSLREDLAFIRDDGTQNKPKGLRHRIASGNVFGSAGNTVANITNDAHTMIENVEGANVPLSRAGWLMTSRDKAGLMRLRGADDTLVFADEVRNGSFLGWPIHVSNQIPKNLGGGGDESEVYFVEFTQTLIADTMAMQLEVFPGGTYHDGAALVSGISQDQTVVRTISLHDFAMRHDEAGSVLTAVTWGV